MVKEKLSKEIYEWIVGYVDRVRGSRYKKPLSMPISPEWSGYLILQFVGRTILLLKSDLKNQYWIVWIRPEKAKGLIEQLKIKRCEDVLSGILLSQIRKSKDTQE